MVHGAFTKISSAELSPPEGRDFYNIFQKSVNVLINNKKHLFSIFRELAIIRPWEKYQARCLPKEAGLLWVEERIKNARWLQLSAK